MNGKETERQIWRIWHWLGDVDRVPCALEDCGMIFNGVYRLSDGNDYSAFMDEENRLVICKNGDPIRRLI